MKNIDRKKALSDLISNENIFREAGRLAQDLQGKVKINEKSNSGNYDVDVVTEADYQVQEFLLKSLLKTDLKYCQMLAEEKSKLTQKFNNDSKLIITIDPIDGTAHYAKGRNLYGTMVGLRDDKNIYYSYKYYPALDWEYKIYPSKVIIKGNFKSDLSFPSKAKKTIVYTSGDPKKESPMLYKKLTSEGYYILHKNDLIRGIGAATMFMANEVAGFYAGIPNAFDGLFVYHLAQVKGYRTYADFDITKLKNDKGRIHHPGYYYVIK